MENLALLECLDKRETPDPLARWDFLDPKETREFGDHPVRMACQAEMDNPARLVSQGLKVTDKKVTLVQRETLGPMVQKETGVCEETGGNLRPVQGRMIFLKKSKVKEELLAETELLAKKDLVGIQEKWVFQV